MKVKILVLMALVATMGLVSCSKDEHEDGVKTDTMPKRRSNCLISKRL